MENLNKSTNIHTIFNISTDMSSAIDQLASDVIIESDVPRHVCIRSKDQTKNFEGLRRFDVARIINKFLNLRNQSAEMTPDVTLWVEYKKEKKLGTVINVKTKSDDQAKTLLNTKEIFGCKVSVEPHSFRNFTKGKVWDREGIFAQYTDEDLAKVLEGRGVAEVKRGQFIEKGVKVFGKQYYLSFNKRTLPPSLDFKDLGIKMKVEKVTPRPMRCFGCQRYGHGKRTCRDKDKNDVCCRCGERHEGDSDDCTAPAKCVNCRSPHKASDTACPVYKQELNIVTLAMEKDITTREAVMILRERNQYVNFSAPTTAQKVFAVATKPIETDRLDKLEKAVNKLAEVITNSPASSTATNPVIVQLQERMQKLEDDNKQTKTRLKSALEEVDRLKEENLRLKASSASVDSMEISAGTREEDLKCELEQFRSEMEATNIKKDEIINKLNAKLESYSQKLEQLNTRLNTRSREKDREKDRNGSDRDRSSFRHSQPVKHVTHTNNGDGHPPPPPPPPADKGKSWRPA